MPRKLLKPDEKAVFEDGHHRLAAFKNLECSGGQHGWKPDVLWEFLMKPQGGVLMSAPEIVLYSRSCKKLPGFVLTDRLFMNTTSTLLIFAKSFGIEFKVSFCNSRQTLVDDLISSNFLSGASHSPCMRLVRVAKLMIQCLLVRSYVEDTRSNVCQTTRLYDKRLRSLNDKDAVLLLQAAERNLMNPEMPKGELPERCVIQLQESTYMPYKYLTAKFHLQT